MAFPSTEEGGRILPAVQWEKDDVRVLTLRLKPTNQAAHVGLLHSVDIAGPFSVGTVRRFCTIVGDFLLFRGHLIAVVMTVAEVAEKLGKSLEETRKLIGGGDVDSSLLLAADGNGGAANGDELLLTDLDEDDPDEEEGLGEQLADARVPQVRVQDAFQFKPSLVPQTDEGLQAWLDGASPAPFKLTVKQMRDLARSWGYNGQVGMMRAHMPPQSTTPTLSNLKRDMLVLLLQLHVEGVRRRTLGGAAAGGEAAGGEAGGEAGSEAGGEAGAAPAPAAAAPALAVEPTALPGRDASIQAKLKFIEWWLDTGAQP